MEDSGCCALSLIQGYHYSNDVARYALLSGFAHGGIAHMCMLIAAQVKASNKNKNP